MELRSKRVQSTLNRPMSVTKMREMPGIDIDEKKLELFFLILSSLLLPGDT